MSRRIVSEGAKPRDGGGTGRFANLSEGRGELTALVVGYLKQETLGPLRGLVRFVLYGVVGAVALSGGTTLLLIALLRLLQGETGGTFGGDRSWLPYLITAVAAAGALGVAAWRIVSGPSRRRSALSPSSKEA